MRCLRPALLLVYALVFAHDPRAWIWWGGKMRCSTTAHLPPRPAGFQLSLCRLRAVFFVLRARLPKSARRKWENVKTWAHRLFSSPMYRLSAAGYYIFMHTVVVLVFRDEIALFLGNTIHRHHIYQQLYIKSLCYKKKLQSNPVDVASFVFYLPAGWDVFLFRNVLCSTTKFSQFRWHACLLLSFIVR